MTAKIFRGPRSSVSTSSATPGADHVAPPSVEVAWPTVMLRSGAWPPSKLAQSPQVTRAFRHEGERQHLAAITDGELSAVTFVRDYIQLHFDGRTISAFTLPTVVVGSNVFLPPHPGYRDALCALIGNVVTAAYADPGLRLQIDFADGSSLSISLKPEDHVVEEAAVYEDAQTREWASW